MESPLHLELKAQALSYLAQLGCEVRAAEVTAPLARFRVDAAGYRFAGATNGEALWPDLWPETFLIECKATREDFLRCTRHHAALCRERQALRTRLVQQAGEFARADEEPVLGDRLFAESAGPLRTRAVLTRRLRRVERDAYAAAKFDLFTRYRLGTYLLLVTGPGVLNADELPAGWGWLEAGAGSSPRVAPPRLDPPPKWRARLMAAARRSAARER